MRDALKELDIFAETLSHGLKSDADQSNLGEELENELGDMERAIEEAAARIAQLWDSSKQNHTGIKLEVNDKVLDSCTGLMAAIIQLINKAKTLQEEIVAGGKGALAHILDCQLLVNIIVDRCINCLDNQPEFHYIKIKTHVCYRVCIS